MGKRKGKTALFVIAAVLLMTAAAVFLGTRTQTGTLALRILDGATDQPISGAWVAVPEAGFGEATDEAGETPRILVPVRRDTRFDAILRQTFGTVTVLVYRDGYLPLAIFHVAVRAGQDRETLTLWLFPDDGSMEEPFSMIESPDPAWVERLLSRYAPGRD